MKDSTVPAQTHTLGTKSRRGHASAWRLHAFIPPDLADEVVTGEFAPPVAPDEPIRPPRIQGKLAPFTDKLEVSADSAAEDQVSKDRE